MFQLYIYFHHQAGYKMLNKETIKIQYNTTKTIQIQMYLYSFYSIHNLL